MPISSSDKIGITEDQIRHIASLACIKLTNSKITKYQKQFQDIIGYFKKLQEINTKGIQPTSQVTGIINRLRKDEAADFLSQKHALQNAACREDGYFTVLPVKKSSV